MYSVEEGHCMSHGQLFYDTFELPYSSEQTKMGREWESDLAIHTPIAVPKSFMEYLGSMSGLDL